VTTLLPDPLAELRRTRPIAPPAVRERVRQISARHAAPTRRITESLTWRRALLVLVPAVLAVVVGGVVLSGRDSGQRSLGAEVVTGSGTHGAVKGLPFSTQAQAPTAARDAALPPSRTRLQDYDASLTLKVKNADALSDASKRALAIARSLGGYASAVTVDVKKGEGDASIRLRIPVQNVQRAVTRLSELGTITGESVHVRDLQAGVDQLDRRIARLQKQLRALRSQEQTDVVKRQITALTAQVERLQRGRGATVRDAHLATVDLSMTTREQPKAKQHHEPGPLHGAWVALTWMGIAALYALIVGAPVLLLAGVVFLAWRTIRRRRVEHLLSESG